MKSPESSRNSLRNEMLAVLGIETDDNSDGSTIETEAINVNLLRQQIEDSSSRLGEIYEKLSQIKGFGEAYAGEIHKVAKVLEQRVIDDDSTLAFNALNELGLIMQVENLLQEGDFEHINVFEVAVENQQKGLGAIQVNLEGVALYLKSYADDDDSAVTHHVQAKFARWKFDPNGIRLEIEYEDPTSGETLKTQARLDFHYRKNPKFDTDKKQAAIDLDGRYLRRAIQASEELGRDYHRYELLDPH